MHSIIRYARHRHLATAPAGLLLLFLVLSLPLSASAGVYKWVDADGKVHFTDKPPPEVDAETIKTNTTRDPHTAERLNKFKEKADKGVAERAEKRAAIAAEKEEEKKNAEKCTAVRKELFELETSTRRQTLNAQGELEFIPEETRQEWMRVSRENIKKVCK